jgi:hypothetical protein
VKILIFPILKNITITGNPALYGKLEIDDTVDLGDDFLLSGTACIGTEESNDCDNFDFTIISPKALERKLNKTDFIYGRTYFIVKDFDINLLEDKIKEIISNCRGETWEEIALILRPYFYWEYEK